MNRMTFMVKFDFIGLLLLLPFAYVTHVMVKGSDKQIVFNTYAAAVLAGDGSFQAELSRETREIDALFPAITEDMSQACALGIALVAGPDGASEGAISEGKLAIHAFYADAVRSPEALQDVNLKTAYDYNNTKSRACNQSWSPWCGPRRC